MGPHGSRTIGLIGALLISFALLAPAAGADTSTVTFGSNVTIPNVSELDGIACPQSGECYAVGTESKVDGGLDDTDAVVVPIVDGTPGTPVAVPAPSDAQPGYTMDPGDIVCPSASICYVDGYFDTAGSSITNSGGMIITVTNGVPATPQISGESDSSAPGVNAFYGLACWSATSCEAVGDTGSDNTYYGVSAPVTSGVPGTVTEDTNVSGLGVLVCPSADACDALGTDVTSGATALVSVTASSDGANQDLPTATGGSSFACFDATSCLLLGANAYTPFDDGTLGTAVSAQNIGGSGACTAATDCMTVGETGEGVGYATLITDGTAGAQTLDYDAESLRQVVCSSATSCLATGASDNEGADAILVPISVTSGSGGSGSGGSGSGGSGSSSSKTAVVKAAGVTEKSNVVSVPLTCSVAACTATITETIKVSKRTETVATATVHLVAGTAKTTKLTLDAAGRAALKKAKRLEATITVTASGKTVKRATVSLKAATTKKKTQKK